jgi:hypothetical protein
VFIQETINRMGLSGNTVKAWLMPVVTAAYGYAVTKGSVSVAGEADSLSCSRRAAGRLSLPGGAK